MVCRERHGKLYAVLAFIFQLTGRKTIDNFQLAGRKVERCCIVEIQKIFLGKNLRIYGVKFF